MYKVLKKKNSNQTAEQAGIGGLFSVGTFACESSEQQDGGCLCKEGTTLQPKKTPAE